MCFVTGTEASTRTAAWTLSIYFKYTEIRCVDIKIQICHQYILCTYLRSFGVRHCAASLSNMYCIGGWSGCCSSASVRLAWVSSSCGRPASHITCWLRSLRTSDLSTSQVCAWRSRESCKWRDAVNVLNFNIFLNFVLSKRMYV